MVTWELGFRFGTQCFRLYQGVALGRMGAVVHANYMLTTRKINLAHDRATIYYLISIRIIRARALTQSCVSQALIRTLRDRVTSSCLQTFQDGVVDRKDDRRARPEPRHLGTPASEERADAFTLHDARQPSEHATRLTLISRAVR